MFTEYYIQMKVNGEWKPALNMLLLPWRKGQPVREIEKAEQGMQALQGLWAENYRNHPQEKIPTDFRIVARVVSEWEAV